MINRSLIPKPFTIDLWTLTDASEISALMRDRNIKMYVYAFVSIYGVMKFGSSKDYEWKRKKQYGNRIYRQAHHIPGWINGVAEPDTSGNDFLNTIQKYPSSLTKNDVWIIVWDMSHYPVLSKSFPKEIEEFENELIQDYCSMYGKRPIGNPKDTAAAANVFVVADTVFEQIFEEAA